MNRCVGGAIDAQHAIACCPHALRALRDPASTFEVLLRERDLTSAQALMGYLKEVEPNDWPGSEIELLARGWGDDVVKLADDWATLDARERFAVLQQVSSTLRTGLTKDVESRLR
jgi:hypothetical protein